MKNQPCRPGTFYKRMEIFVVSGSKRYMPGKEFFCRSYVVCTLLVVKSKLSYLTQPLWSLRSV